MKKRVKIPQNNPLELLSLVNLVKQKHVADGDASPLRLLNWEQAMPIIDAATEANERALRLRREMLEAFQQRDLRMNDVTKHVRNSRDILAGIHSAEMKALGQWGFDVLDARSSKPDVVKPAV